LQEEIRRQSRGGVLPARRTGSGRGLATRSRTRPGSNSDTMSRVPSASSASPTGSSAPASRR
jgi:hypothetical protein